MSTSAQSLDHCVGVVGGDVAKTTLVDPVIPRASRPVHVEWGSTGKNCVVGAEVSAGRRLSGVVGPAEAAHHPSTTAVAVDVPGRSSDDRDRCFCAVPVGAPGDAWLWSRTR